MGEVTNRNCFACHGASNHSERERSELDYYATDPQAVKMLLKKESFDSIVWECAVVEDTLRKN